MAVNLSPVFGVAGQLFDNNGNPLAGGKIFTYLAGTTTNTATYTSSSGTIAHSNPIILDGAGRVPSGEIWLTDGITYKFVVQDSANNLIGSYDNLIGINSNFVAFTNQQEIQTATAGQTVFNLTTMQYAPGTNSLSVFVDGVNQYGPGALYAYVETDENTVTFVSGLHVGASVKFTTSQLNSSGSVDAAQVSYNPPFANSVATNVEDKLAQTVSVLDFGADLTGVVDSTAAFNAALATGSAVYVPTGTYLANITATQLFNIYGDGMNKSVITPFNTALPAFKNMADPGSANFWRRCTIASLSLRSTGPTGNGFTFGDPAAFANDNVRIGRVDFQDVEITGFNKAVFKTCGNIGNNFFNCRIQNNNYNYYAQSSDYASPTAPAMHSGFDSFYGGAWGYAGLASVFIRDRILGKGGWTFRDVDIEGSTGYAVVALADGTFDYVPDLTFDACWFEANATSGSITIDGLTTSITGLPRDIYVSGIKHIVAKEIYLGKLTLLNGCNFIADKCGADTVTAGVFNLSIDASSTFVVDGWTYTTGMKQALTFAPYASTTDNASTSYTAVTNTVPGPICAPVKDYTTLLGYSGTAPIVAGGGGYNGSVVADGLTFNTCSEYIVTGSAAGIVPTVTTVIGKYYAVTFQARLASGSPGYFYVNDMTDGELIDHSDWRHYAFVKKATTVTSGFSANSSGVSSTLRIGAMQIVQFDSAKDAYEYLYRGRIATNSDARSAAYPLAAFTDAGGGAGVSFNSATIAATVTNLGYTKLCEANLKGDLPKIKVDFLLAFSDLNTGPSQDQLSGFTTVAFASTASTPTQVFGAGTVTFRWVQQGSTKVWDLQGQVTSGPSTAICLAGLAFIKGN
jgi:hypothetical protein